MEQGFCYEQHQITIQPINLEASVTTDNFRHPPTLPTSQQKKYSSILTRSIYIDHNIRTQWMTEIYQKNAENIVFNNVDRSKMTPTKLFNFESQFESGNLDMAIRVNSCQYQLYLRPDTNTTGNIQWFYFAVTKIRKNRTIIFKIVNFSKPNLLYTQGLPVYVRSDEGQWKYIRQDAVYQPQNSEFFSLTFKYEFLENAQIVYFSSQPPYTFTTLMHDLESYKQTRMYLLCNSLLGFKIPRLQIKSNVGKISSVGLAIARQHPGEVVSSWIMKGFIEKLLTQKYPEVLWHVFPMINVDGVFMGNNRTGIIGYDINRLWNNDDPCSFNKDKYIPQINAVYSIAKKLKEKYGKMFKLFLDFHGHSTKQNIFAYGPPYKAEETGFCQARLFPELINIKCKYFSIQDCNYVIPSYKKNAARSIMFEKLKVPFCYTIQASFGLSNQKIVSSQDYVSAGKDIAQATYQFLNYLTRKIAKPSIIQLKKKILERLKAVKKEDKKCGLISEQDSEQEDINETERLMHLANVQSDNKIVSKQISLKKLNTTSFKIKESPRKFIVSKYAPQKKQFTQTRSRQFMIESLFLKPLVKKVPKVQYIKEKNVSKIRSSRTRYDRINTYTALSNKYDEDLLSKQKMIMVSVDKYKEKLIEKTKDLRPTSISEIQNRLIEVAKNKRNVIGNKMLIINEI